jgi:hypothetical protein
MVATRIAAIVVTVVLGTAANTFAQSGGYDPLNPLNKRQVQRGSRSVATAAPVRSATGGNRAGVTWQPEAGSYEAYLAEYQRWYASEAERRSGPSGFMKFMNGLSVSLSVTDQAIGVYEHGVEARALSRYYNGK